MKLKWTEVQGLVPELPGTNHGYHCKEGKGNDRLYVTLKDSGEVLAYCHHCGARGRFSMDVSKYAVSPRTPTYAGSGVKKVTLPYDLVEDFTKFPSNVQGWITKYGITPREAEQASIGYSPSLDRVILPCYYKGELEGFEARSITGAEPKSLHYGSRLQQAWPHLTNEKSICLVEDYLSGIKVNRFVNTHVNFGTHLTNDKVKRLKEQFPKVTEAFIFFDNDNSQVKGLQLQAKKLIEVLWGIEAVVVLSNKDPKEHTDQELKELFNV